MCKIYVYNNGRLSDVKKAAGCNWMRKTEDRLLLHKLGESMSTFGLRLIERAINIA